MHQDRLVQRGRPREHADFLCRNCFKDPVDIKDWLGNNSCPRHERRQESRFVAKGMKERIHHQVAIPLTQANNRCPRCKGAQGLRMRRHRSLGVARRPRRENQITHVPRLNQRTSLGRVLRRDGFATLNQVIKCEHCNPLRVSATARSFEHDDLFEIADVESFEHCGVVEP